MQRRTNFVLMVLAGVVVLSLTPLMAVVDAQAQIDFSSDRDGNSEIYVMDINGKNQRRLTKNHGDDWSPSWSPDGKRIVFVSDRDGHAKHGWPASEIYVMDADGGNPQNLTNNPADDGFPSWSPDGKQIVFSSARDEHFGYEIYVVDADGGDLQRLTENLKHEWDPVWSPDGERIAFSSDRKGDWVNFEIYVMDADGGNQQRLTENLKHEWDPVWSPDGERIAFMSEMDGNPEIYVMDINGGNQQNLTNNRHDDCCPSWLNSPFSVSPADRKFTIWGRLRQID